jgi:acyl-coenzyme A thioesterase PaaI-like protein
MTFKLVDEMLSRHASGDGCSPAAKHLDMRLVRFARGVAVYEMPGRFAENSMLVALAETAMNAAATTTVPDEVGGLGMTTRDLCAHFHSPVEDGVATLRAEAIIVHSDGETVRVEADVLADGRRVASFEANSAAAAS